MMNPKLLNALYEYAKANVSTSDFKSAVVGTHPKFGAVLYVETATGNHVVSVQKLLMSTEFKVFAYNLYK